MVGTHEGGGRARGHHRLERLRITVIEVVVGHEDPPSVADSVRSYGRGRKTPKVLTVPVGNVICQVRIDVHRHVAEQDAHACLSEELEWELHQTVSRGENSDPGNPNPPHLVNTTITTVAVAANICAMFVNSDTTSIPLSSGSFLGTTTTAPGSGFALRSINPLGCCTNLLSLSASREYPPAALI